jgi:hypothetical protein
MAKNGGIEPINHSDLLLEILKLYDYLIVAVSNAFLIILRVAFA